MIIVDKDTLASNMLSFAEWMIERENAGYRCGDIWLATVMAFVAAHEGTSTDPVITVAKVKRLLAGLQLPPVVVDDAERIQ